MMRVFIGTDERGGRGEIVLSYQIPKYISESVDIVFMRPDEEYRGQLFWNDWYMGRDHFIPYSSQGWATNFTCFRFSIPEASGFEGRSIYIDADITVHGDLVELANTDLAGKPCAIRPGVIVFDCGHTFWKLNWPTIEQMKKSGNNLGFYTDLLKGSTTSFDPLWCVLDGDTDDIDKVKLHHYTKMQFQPYHPFPDRFNYPRRHPKPVLDIIWWNSYREALNSYGLEIAPVDDFNDLLERCLLSEHLIGLDYFGRPPGFNYLFTDFEVVENFGRKKNPWWRKIN